MSEHPDGDVLDFAPAPDGGRVLYSVLDGERGALRLVTAGGDHEVLACPGAECSAPVWSPDGRHVVYERRELADAGRVGSPRLHWLDPTAGETLPLIAGGETPGYGARFSPDGTWLSYVSPGDDGVVLYRLADGRQRLLSSRVGRPAVFSPDSGRVIVSDIVLKGHQTSPEAGDDAGPIQESSSVYLYVSALGESEMEESSRTQLSPDAPVDDSAPAWSPDGEWVVFGRTPADAATGRQLWLMRPDGGEARALTNAPNIFHGPAAWSPDGEHLLFQRFDLNDPAAEPEVWRLRLDDGTQTRLAPGGFLPVWLPGGW